MNAGILASGSIGASIIALVSFAFLARVLEPELFGVLALIQAYAAIVDRLVNFQSWQALIKFGVQALADKDFKGLEKLFSFGFALDIATAILGFLIGICLPFLIGTYLGWSVEKTNLAAVFAIIILFNIEGTPTAILRIFDEFKQFAYRDILVALLKLGLVIIGVLLSQNIWYFALITMVSMVTGYLYLIIVSLKILKQNNISINFIGGIKSLRTIEQKYKGIWTFIWTTNLHGSVRMLSLTMDTIIVDTILGSVATGLYQVTKQFAKVFTQVSQPLYKSIYPELSSLWANKKKQDFFKLLKSFCLLGFIFSSTFWVIFYFFGKDIITLTVGGEYFQSYDILIWYLLGVVLSISTFPITPALLALGFPKLSFYALLFSSINYLICIFLFIHYYGIVGIGLSYFLLYLVWLLVIVYFYKTRIKKIL